MKNLILPLFALLFVFSFQLASGQNGRTSIGVLNIDTKNTPLSAAEMGNLIRLELQKLDTFEVLDIYDVKTILTKEKFVWETCYGKLCLVDAGKILKSDLMLSGSVEKYGNMAIFTLRIINVNSGLVERTKVTEFINVPNEYQTLCHLALCKLLNYPVKADIETHFIKPPSFVNLDLKPEMEKLNLEGPRMGITMFTGNNAQILKAPANEGGYNTNPFMFQFGYQFEKQYITSGNFQALFEFIPMISGLEKGMFVPSAALLNGIRSNKSGWEFAFGPVFSVTRVAEGSYDNGIWHLASEFDSINKRYYPGTEVRMDSRGDTRLNASFLFGVGKTIRKGNLNIPLNLFAVPSKNGVRVGFSMGYNVRKNKTM